MVPSHQLKRRHARTGVWAALLVAGLAGASEPRLHQFEVLLDGRRIGTHRFEVTPTAAGGERVFSRAEFNVKLLGITVYRYRHEARELWQDGCLASLESTTHDNGAKVLVRATQSGDVFRVEGADASQPAVQCAVAYAYWDPQRLLAQGTLLNPQTGRFDAVTFHEQGMQPLQVGTTLTDTRKVQLRNADGAIDLWYAPDGRWLQLATAARGNRQLVYRRMP